MRRTPLSILRCTAPTAALAALLSTGPALLWAGPALADKIKHPTAVFAGLDKITGRIIAFDVATDETVQFGSLQVTPRVCYTRPQTEAPLTTGFVEVEEVTSTNEFKKIFSGWMFAASPGLHGVEHPVYDVWLTDCKGGSEIIRDVVSSVPQENLTPAPNPPPARRAPAQQPAARAPSQGTIGSLPAGSPLPPPPPRANAPAALPQGAALPPPPRASSQGGLLPPGNIPNVPPGQRRSPSQTYYPTVADPSGERY